MSLPTQPGDFPDGQHPTVGARPPRERPERERPERRLRGFALLPALLLGVVGVVYAAWYLLPEFLDSGERGSIPVFFVYLVLGFIAGAVPGFVIGLAALAGVSLVHELGLGLRSQLVAVSLFAGAATAIVLAMFLPYAGIDMPWLHIALTVLVPATLCCYAAR